MRLWTDYPIVALGDEPTEPAPVRECWIQAYDGNKYATILVGSTLVRKIIKIGYIYKAEGRYGDVPPLTHDEATSLATVSS